MDKNNNNRWWSKEETLAFLQAYSARKEEFTHVRKKKVAMNNVLEDLIALGVLKEETTVEMLNVKLKNLLRAYKSSKDNQRKTGAAPCIAPFEDIMEEIFGEKPIIANTHTVDLSGIQTEPLPCSSVPDIVDMSSQEEKKPKKRRTEKEKYFENKLKLKREVADKKQKMASDYLALKLKKYDEENKAKEKRHQEKLLVLKTFLENQSKP